MKYYLAIDIGASSGRHIVGFREKGELRLDEVYRFRNGMTEENGRLTWDLERLVREVKTGIAEAKAKYGTIESLAVDTWGVDYVLMNGGNEILPCFSYRDPRTEKAVPEVHERIPFDELYRRTGIQFQPFNTVYQLYADKLAGRLENATDLLMIPEYLIYRLTGVKTHEYTNASTGGMLSAETGDYDRRIIEKLGLPERLFRTPEKPGKTVGTYEGIRVLLCATHDTASAIHGIPMKDDQIYLSSGTWSLLGVKLPAPRIPEGELAGRWTNEGGVGCVTFLKNIMGMWIVNRLRDELCPGMDFSEIVKSAEKSVFPETVDVNGPVFLAPESMKEAFDGALSADSRRKPGSPADYFRCAFRSLAKCYASAVRELETIFGKTYEEITIAGGGARNAFLNALTAEATGKRVVALPIEATAAGNLKVQMDQGGE